MLAAGHEDNTKYDSDDSDNSKPAKRLGRRKMKIEFIQDKNRRHITFSKRKAGIMKKAYELSTLTGTQILLLVVSETGLVYTYTTAKLQPIVTKPEGKSLIQACLNAPDFETKEEIKQEKTQPAPITAPVSQDTKYQPVSSQSPMIPQQNASSNPNYSPQPTHHQQPYQTQNTMPIPNSYSSGIPYYPNQPYTSSYGVNQQSYYPPFYNK